MTARPPALPFLVTGLPKTGTTFLQRTLNLHPQISCPSEQIFGFLSSLTGKLLKEYRNALRVVDRRTGGQGVAEYGASIENDMLAAAIGTLSKSFARGRPVHGLNDNGVFSQVALFDNLLGRPKIVGIIRNHVDTSLSSWRHCIRLAREEPDLAAQHLAILENPKKNAEGYIEKMLPFYQGAVEQFLDYTEGHPNVMAISYERLVAAKETEIPRILSFLGVSWTDEIMTAMLRGSSREAMAASSRAPAFFGIDVKETDRGTITREFRRAALEASISPRMKQLGYDATALMLGH